ncbi:GNAT family N-acetyltransferase [Candidatus Micrarchaeota archaeon]|nr:GNAT family N-acetyltransferase [Candidatus Micrarchaeota archaeon]
MRITSGAEPIPETAIRGIQGVNADGNWNVVYHKIGLTHKGEQVRLVHLNKDDPHGLEHHLFIAMHPKSGEVIAIRALNETKEKDFALQPHTGRDFEVKEGWRNRGVGSALTAQAAEYCLERKKNVFTKRFTNERWKNAYSRMGFRIKEVMPGVAYAIMRYATTQTEKPMEIPPHRPFLLK